MTSADTHRCWLISGPGLDTRRMLQVPAVDGETLWAGSLRAGLMRAEAASLGVDAPVGVPGPFAAVWGSGFLGNCRPLGGGGLPFRSGRSLPA